MAGSMIESLDDLLKEVRSRVANLEQRITNPAVAVGNGMSVTFPDITLGVPGQPGVRITKDITPPTGLTVVTGAVYGNIYADISWTAPADSTAPEYEIQVAEKSATGAYATSIVRRTASTSIRIEGLQPNSTYGVRVYSVSRLGDTSDPLPATGWRDFATSADATVPAQVTGLKVTSGATSITASWSENTEADVANGNGMYEIQYDTASTFAAPTSNKVSATITSFTGLDTTITYYFRVRAIDASGNEGPWSATVSATPGGTSGAASDGLAPTATPAPVVRDAAGFIYVRWSGIDNPDPVTYDVFMGTGTTFPLDATTQVTSTDSTYAVIKALPDGTTLPFDQPYYFVVRGRDNDGIGPASNYTGPGHNRRVTDIEPGVITAESGIIASLDAGVITVGEMSGERIQAGTITARSLVVGASTNLALNSSFEQGSTWGSATDWLEPARQHFYVSHREGTWVCGTGGNGTENRHSGTSWAQFTLPVNVTLTGTPLLLAGAVNGGLGTFKAGHIPAREGERIKVEFYAGVRGNAYTGSGLRAYISFRGPDGNSTASTAGTYTRPASAAGTSGANTLITHSAVAPAGTTHVIFGVQIASDNVVDAGGTSATFIVDDLFGGRMVGSTLIEDGAITTGHITTGTINSDHIITAGLDATVIKFGTMSGDRIQANTLGVEKITSGTLVSRTITLSASGYLRGLNSGGGTGWLLNEDGFKIYNSGGTPTVSLNRDGSASFSGNITGSNGTFYGDLSGGTITGGRFQTSSSTGVERIVIDGRYTSGNEKRNRVTFWSTNVNNPPAYLEVYNYIGQTTYGQVVYFSSGVGSSTINSGHQRAAYLRLQPDYGGGSDGVTMGVENSPSGGTWMRASSTQGINIGLGSIDGRIGNDYYSNYVRLNLDCIVAVSGVNYNSQYYHHVTDFIYPGGYSQDSDGVRISDRLHLIGQGAGTQSAVPHVFSSGTNIRIGTQSALYVQHPTTGAYRTVYASAFSVQSAENSKKDIAKHDKGMAALKKIRPVKFRKKSDPDGPEVLGVIAEEVAAAIPEAVVLHLDDNGEQEKMVMVRDEQGRIVDTKRVKEFVRMGASPEDPNAEAGTLFGVDPMGLISALLAGLQEVDARLDRLEAAGPRTTK